MIALIQHIIRGGAKPDSAKTRNTNLELLRIIAMLTIIAHHYVVNSGITDCFDDTHITPNMIFLQLWGMWGKTAINVFVMITGYFMCRKRLTVKRFAKMYLEVKFYTIAIYVIFLISGYEQAALRSIFKMLFGNIYYIGNGFTASFFVFYLFISFYNKLLDCLNQKEHLRLLILLLAIYVGASTFFFCDTVFSEPVWYMVLYFTAAYIRLYGKGTWLENNKIIGPALAVLVITAYMSVIVIDYIRSGIKLFQWGYMVFDSNKLLAFLIGVGAFCFFNNLKINNNRTINQAAASTFGVLCIHANSDAMRYWLWQELLNVKDMYTVGLGQLMIHASVSVILIFMICVMIDMVRIRILERPAMKFLERYTWFHSAL